VVSVHGARGASCAAHSGCRPQLCVKLGGPGAKVAATLPDSIWAAASAAVAIVPRGATIRGLGRTGGTRICGMPGGAEGGRTICALAAGLPGPVAAAKPGGRRGDGTEAGAEGGAELGIRGRAFAGACGRAFPSTCCNMCAGGGAEGCFGIFDPAPAGAGCGCEGGRGAQDGAPRGGARFSLGGVEGAPAPLAAEGRARCLGVGAADVDADAVASATTPLARSKRWPSALTPRA